MTALFSTKAERGRTVEKFNAVEGMKQTLARVEKYCRNKRIIKTKITKQEIFMEPENKTAAPSKTMFRIGWILSILAILFLIMDAVMKLMKPEMVVDINKKLGYAENAIVPIAVVLLICTALYAFPRTALLGAILLTGYLGGAIATQVRVSSPETNQGFGGEVSNIIFPLVIAAFIWGGLYLRESRLRQLLPVTSKSGSGR
jgi:hypothetical protein